MPAGSLVERLAERLPSGAEPVPRRVWLVARSRRAADRLALLAACRAGATVGVRPVGLPGLAWQLAATTCSDELVPEWVEPALVRAALSEQPGQLTRPARQPGGTAWLTAAVRLVRGLAPGRFWDGPREHFPQPDSPGEREHLARLAAACEQHLEQHGLVDRARATRLARDGRLDGVAEQVLFVHADRPAPLERDLLESLADRLPVLWLRPVAESPGSGTVTRGIAAGGSLATACRRTAEDVRRAVEAGHDPGEMAVAVFGGRGRRRCARALLARFGMPSAAVPGSADPELEAVAAVLTGRATREQVLRLLLAGADTSSRVVSPRQAFELTAQAECDGVDADDWWSRLQTLARGLERSGGASRPRAAAARALASSGGDLLHRAHRLRRRLRRRGAAATWWRIGEELRAFFREWLGTGGAGWRAVRAADDLAALDRLRLPPSIELAIGLWLDRARRGESGEPPAPPRGVPVVSAEELAETGARLVWGVEDPSPPGQGLALPGPLDVPEPPWPSTSPGRGTPLRWLAGNRPSVATLVAPGWPEPAIHATPPGVDTPWTRPAILERRRRAHRARVAADAPPGPFNGSGLDPEPSPRLTLEDLTDLAECPFRLFLRYRVRLPRAADARGCSEPDAEEISAVTRRVLDDAWSGLPMGETVPGDEIADRAAGRAERWTRLRVEEARGGGACGLAAFWDAVARRLERRLPTTVRRELRRARRLSLSRGRPLKRRIVELDRCGARVAVPLSVDRCDLRSDGARLATIWTDGSLPLLEAWQRSLVADAAWTAGVDDPEVQLTALRFVRMDVDRGAGEPSIWTPATSARWATAQRLIVGGLLERVRRGALFPAPRWGEASCSACPYRRVCTPQDRGLARAKASVPAIGAHAELVGSLR